MSIAVQSFDVVAHNIGALAFGDAKKHYQRVSIGLTHALEDLNIHLIGGVESVYLTVQDNMTVDLPRDCIAPFKVGACDNGEVRIIVQNSKLCHPVSNQDQQIDCDACTCGTTAYSNVATTTDTDTTDTTCTACTFHNCGGFPVYGIPVRTKLGGSWDWDKMNHRLVLGDGRYVGVGKKVLLEYKASMTAAKFQMIPKSTFQCLYWKVLELMNANQAVGKSRNQREVFKEEYYRLKELYSNMTLEDWIQAFASGYLAAPKPFGQ